MTGRIPRFNRGILLLALALFVVLVVALAVLKSRLRLPAFGWTATTDQVRPRTLPDALTRFRPTYGPVPETPQEQTQPTVLAHAAPLLSATPPPPAAFAQQPQRDVSSIPVAVPIENTDSVQPRQQDQRQAQTMEPRRKRNQKWGIKPTDITIQDPITPSREAQQAIQDEAQAQQLIKHALWARPANVKKTLYRQQTIPGITMDEMVSSIPGEYRIRVTVPVFNRFYPDYELIPKDTVVIVKQEGGPGYGDTRLKVIVDELQPPTPEVIKLAAVTGGADGQSGLTGKVNNHYGKLILATVISTALNIGPRLAAGSPQGFNYNVGQEVSREAGSQIAQDARSIVDKQLRVPPTVTIPKDTPVTIRLSENVTFSRSPIVVR